MLHRTVSGMCRSVFQIVTLKWSGNGHGQLPELFSCTGGCGESIISNANDGQEPSWLDDKSSW